jgi:hypothetical protein
MGLDMYLEKEVVVGAMYDYLNVTGKIEVFHDGVSVPVNFKRVYSITEQVAYWRKANQIHKWFVDNVQKGKDDCNRYYVEQEQLEILLDNLERLLKSKSNKLAIELLPPSDGFFFGGSDMDKWYWEDLKYTKKVLTNLLDELAKEKAVKIFSTIYYKSSW